VGVKPRSPKGRAAARELDARPCLQHLSRPAGDKPTKNPIDRNHGIYPRESAWHSLCGCGPEGSSGGYEPGILNLWAASAPFIKDVVAHWNEWKHGIPE
jgi:hypothetical protein